MVRPSLLAPRSRRARGQGLVRISNGLRGHSRTAGKVGIHYQDQASSGFRKVNMRIVQVSWFTPFHNCNGLALAAKKFIACDLIA